MLIWHINPKKNYKLIYWGFFFLSLVNSFFYSILGQQLCYGSTFDKKLSLSSSYARVAAVKLVFVSKILDSEVS